MLSHRKTLWAAALLLGFGQAACSDPDFVTDLDTEGGPDVIELHVLSESAGDEVAQFCAAGARTNIYFCPEDEAVDDPVMDAVPLGWYVRIVFSELLDPGIEDLVDADTDGDGENDAVFGTLENTQPVTLQCGGADVAYDGYYDPTGNRFSLLPGPALVIEAAEFVATGSSCTVSVKDVVTDKDGTAVVEPGKGFDFAIATMKIATSTPATPADMMPPEVEASTSAITVSMNAPVDPATLDAGQFVVTADAAPVAVTVAVDEMDPTTVVVTVDGGLQPDTTYEVTVTSPDDNQITDTEDGPLTLAEPYVFTFVTTPAA